MIGAAFGGFSSRTLWIRPDQPSRKRNPLSAFRTRTPAMTCEHDDGERETPSQATSPPAWLQLAARLPLLRSRIKLPPTCIRMATGMGHSLIASINRILVRLNGHTNLARETGIPIPSMRSWVLHQVQIYKGNSLRVLSHITSIEQPTHITSIEQPTLTAGFQALAGNAVSSASGHTAAAPVSCTTNHGNTSRT